VSVERGEGPDDDRPPVRVSSRFACGVTGIKLPEGGVGVVEVERDSCHDLLVGIDFDDVKHLDVKRLGPAIAPDETGTNEDEALATHRKHRRRYVICPDLHCGPNACDLGIPTLPDSRAHNPTAIVGTKIIGQYRGHGVPVAGCEVRPEARCHLTCRVFQRRWAAELFESCERCVEVFLVEKLAAIDQVTFDRGHVDVSPFGLEALP
jgi:hypothetical protein